MKNRPFVQRFGRATSKTTMKVGGLFGKGLYLFGKGLMRGMQDAFSELEEKEGKDERRK
tara:strand:- start:2695 stop:2871 length:177 start_codon:yes stop_codon:yes gene_type:complete